MWNVVALLLEQGTLFGFSQVRCNHLLHQFIERSFWHPAQFFLGFGGVAEQGFDFGGAEVAGVCADDGDFLDCRAALAMTTSFCHHEWGQTSRRLH